MTITKMTTAVIMTLAPEYVLHFRYVLHYKSRWSNGNMPISGVRYPKIEYNNGQSCFAHRSLWNRKMSTGFRQNSSTACYYIEKCLKSVALTHLPWQLRAGRGKHRQAPKQSSLQRTANWCRNVRTRCEESFQWTDQNHRHVQCHAAFNDQHPVTVEIIIKPSPNFPKFNWLLSSPSLPFPAISQKAIVFIQLSI